MSPLALKIPDIDSNLSFLHTLFAIEDLKGTRIEKNENNEIHIIFDGSKPNLDSQVFTMLAAWPEQPQKLRTGEITKEQYDQWRYTFPAQDNSLIWGKTPSQGLSDLLVETLKNEK